MLKTGGADYLANLFVYITFGAPPSIVLMGLMMMMGILTNVVSNNAAAVIGTPIAIGIAQRLGLPLEPFVLAVMFGANLSFATPMAYQTNILIMNAGGYKFGDFVRRRCPTDHYHLVDIERCFDLGLTVCDSKLQLLGLDE